MFIGIKESCHNDVFCFRLRIKGLRPKDTGLYACRTDNDDAKEMTVRISLKHNNAQDIEGKIYNYNKLYPAEEMFV